jgi:hypothetical protein
MHLNLANRRTLIKSLDLPFMSKAVEVGVSRGGYSKYILENCNMSLDSIDPWEFNAEQGTPEESYRLCQARLSPFGDRSRMIKAYSPQASELYENDSLDFVYIDGLHDYESVKKDIIAWFPKVKKGRLLCGHDYNTIKWPGVTKAVTEFCKEHSLQFGLTGTVGNAAASQTGDLDEYDGDEQSWVIIL